MKTAEVFSQADDTARFEWGYEGVEQVGKGADMVVIIDVLSFTTCVAVVVERGGVVFPYRFRDESAAAYAAVKQAMLAGKRGERISLSPASLSILPSGSRIVLPSPNGSTCSVLAQQGGGIVIAACLRNAGAVARFIRERGGTVAVIACGERWPNGALRPAIEDMIAAGAVLSELPDHTLSAEAEVAVAAFQSVKHALPSALLRSASGQELLHRGYREDVAIASRYNISAAVPILDGEGAYRAQPISS